MGARREEIPTPSPMVRSQREMESHQRKRRSSKRSTERRRRSSPESTRKKRKPSWRRTMTRRSQRRRVENARRVERRVTLMTRDPTPMERDQPRVRSHLRKMRSSPERARSQERKPPNSWRTMMRRSQRASVAGKERREEIPTPTLTGRSQREMVKSQREMERDQRRKPPSSPRRARKERKLQRKRRR